MISRVRAGGGSPSVGSRQTVAPGPRGYWSKRPRPGTPPDAVPLYGFPRSPGKHAINAHSVPPHSAPTVARWSARGPTDARVDAAPARWPSGAYRSRQGGGLSSAMPRHGVRVGDPQHACRWSLAYSSSGMDRRGQRVTGVAQTGSHTALDAASAPCAKRRHTREK